MSGEREKHADLLRELEDNALTPNYHRWIYSKFKPYLGRRILEIGGGLGNQTEMYLRDSEYVITVEVVDFLAEKLKEKYVGNENIEVLSMDAGDDALVEKCGRVRIDSVVLVNVLEHIEEDEKVLSNLQKCLVPGGRLFLFVPAYKLLFSDWDVSVGHYRRYGRAELKTKVEEAGFRIIRLQYMNTLGFFAWFLNARILKKTPDSDHDIRSQAVFYDRYVVPFLSVAERIIPVFFGQSLVCVAEAGRTQSG
ncbi:MAG: class I SAM-dependent methyltransferase [bacterium]